MSADSNELPRLSPTGELHHDQIESEPWKIENWAAQLGIPTQKVRQLAAEVGPVFDNIKRRWEEELKARLVADAAKKQQRD
jgi:hypothetical protein